MMDLILSWMRAVGAEFILTYICWPTVSCYLSFSQLNSEARVLASKGLTSIIPIPLSSLVKKMSITPFERPHFLKEGSNFPK